jgi:hypothetical protein
MTDWFIDVSKLRVSGALRGVTVFWPLADGAGRNDISHRLSTTLRKLIAFFSYRTT